MISFEENTYTRGSVQCEQYNNITLISFCMSENAESQIIDTIEFFFLIRILSCVHTYILSKIITRLQNMMSLS